SLTRYFDEVVLQHIPDYAYGEPIAVELEGTDSRIFLRRSYEDFVDRLTELSSPWESLEESRRDREIIASIADARAKVQQAKRSSDPQLLDELIRLGIGLIGRDVGAGNIEDIITAVLEMADIAVRSDLSAATLLASSAVD